MSETRTDDLLQRSGAGHVTQALVLLTQPNPCEDVQRCLSARSTRRGVRSARARARRFGRCLHPPVLGGSKVDAIQTVGEVAHLTTGRPERAERAATKRKRRAQAVSAHRRRIRWGPKAEGVERVLNRPISSYKPRLGLLMDTLSVVLALKQDDWQVLRFDSDVKGCTWCSDPGRELILAGMLFFS